MCDGPASHAQPRLQLCCTPRSGSLAPPCSSVLAAPGSTWRMQEMCPPPSPSGVQGLGLVLLPSLSAEANVSLAGDRAGASAFPRRRFSSFWVFRLFFEGEREAVWPQGLSSGRAFLGSLPSTPCPARSAEHSLVVGSSDCPYSWTGSYRTGTSSRAEPQRCPSYPAPH